LPSKARSRGALRSAALALEQAQDAVKAALSAVSPAELLPPVAAPATAMPTNDREFSNLPACVDFPRAKMQLCS
jgi:hypothetical protein